MDYHSLAAAHLPRNGRPAIMDGEAEDRYYRDHAERPRPKLGPLSYVATAAGLILLIAGIAQI